MINIAVEGESDREAAKAVVHSAGRSVAKVVVAGGKSKLDPKIAKYNVASAQATWVVFRDSDGTCPVELRRALTSKIADWSPRFMLRIAHTMTEAWLLADRKGFSEYFHVRIGSLPTDPESLNHAKQSLLQLCSKSRSRVIRNEIVTADGHTGPLYVARINSFAAERWDVREAAKLSPTLDRAIRSIVSLP